MGEKKEIKVEVLRVLYPKDGFYFSDYEWSILLVRSLDDAFSKPITIKGDIFPSYKGLRLNVEGEFLKDKFGEYFTIEKAEKIMKTEDSFREFLEMIAGMATSNRLIAFYGNAKKVIEVLNDSPEKLQEVKGIGEKTVDRIADNYKHNTEFENLYNALKDYGFTIKDCSRIIKKIGVEHVEKIKENPYFLTMHGFSFSRCDEYAEKIGLTKNSRHRLIAGIFEALKQNNQIGNTFALKEDLLKGAVSILTVPGYYPLKKDLETLLELMFNKGYLFEDKDNGYIYTKKSFYEERDIREFIEYSLKINFPNRISKERIADYEREKGFSLGKEQKEAVLNSLEHKVSVITGGPGTGKTTILDCLLNIVSDTLVYDQIALCSPTGKAARRMSEVTGLPAQTIHSLLKVDPTDGTLEVFQHNEHNKLPQKLIVVDEASMIDQFLAASLLRAVRKDTQIVFVGDIEQLPPVGAGYFLRDLIETGVYTTRLLDTYRQSGESTIIKLSQEIRDNKLTRVSAKHDFGFTRFKSDKHIVDMFERGAQKVGIDQIAILTPQNGTMLGVKHLNLKILERLIPKGSVPEVVKNGWIFRVGAKVMQTKNFHKLNLVNGQTGYVTGINKEEKTVSINFDDVIYEFDSEMLDTVILGYAMTVHKSQGSEWKYVIQIVSSMHVNNTKALVYTGITRAKEKLIMVGDLRTLLDAPLKADKDVMSRIF
jgi:exodeoxyribonuclease V alpha subunit